MNYATEGLSHSHNIFPTAETYWKKEKKGGVPLILPAACRTPVPVEYQSQDPNTQPQDPRPNYTTPTPTSRPVPTPRPKYTTQTQDPNTQPRPKTQIQRGAWKGPSEGKGIII